MSNLLPFPFFHNGKADLFEERVLEKLALNNQLKAYKH
jgi:hypothetical protein